MTIQNYIRENSQDAVLFKSNYLFGKETTVDGTARALEAIVKTLVCISGEFKRDQYITQISKAQKIKADIIRRAIAETFDRAERAKLAAELDESDDEDLCLPEGVDAKAYAANGFYPLVKGKKETGYYFNTGSGSSQVQISNCVIRPLYHKYSKVDNTRIIEINNGYQQPRVVEMPSDHLISLEQFKKALYWEGDYMFWGNAIQLMKIVRPMNTEFPVCFELKTLGWQPEGFWAFSNMAYYNGGLMPFNEYGIIDIEFKKEEGSESKKFLSLSASTIHKEVRSDEDLYENDRYLKFIPSTTSFEKWGALFSVVYGQSGWMGIAYSIMTLFRDIVLRTTPCAHLYAYGPVQAGKSQFGESINNLFFAGKNAAGEFLKPFNLNQGTDFAFFNRMERFRNCPNALNEFDENAIPENWFRAIKAAYDGEGREKGAGGRGNKTTSQKINCTLILMGQYLSTRDDNSVLMRCIPLLFKERDNRSEEEKNKFNQLKQWEREGLSGVLLEILKHRPIVQESFAQEFSRIDKRLSEFFNQEQKRVKTRILKNIAAPIALVSLLKDRLRFPFTFEEFYEYGKKMIQDLSAQISESNNLAEFWKVVEFLLDQNKVIEGYDFKIETRSNVRLQYEHNVRDEKNFGQSKKLLFLRVSSVFFHYTEAKSRQGGKGSAMNEQTLITYLKEQPYYIGLNPGSKFNNGSKEINTSSLVLDYDMIGVNLERFKEPEINGEQVTFSGRVTRDAEAKEILGITLLKFTLYKKESVGSSHGLPVSKDVYASCLYKNIQAHQDLKASSEIEVTGRMTISRKGDKEYRTIEVESHKVISPGADSSSTPTQTPTIFPPDTEVPF